MLSIILIVIITALTLVLVLAAGKPHEFRVQRAITIDAPAARIFESIDSFHRWPTWSPWEKLDLAMQRTHSGALTPRGPERTEVSWSMSGPTPFIGKIMHVFVNMDKMVGKDFAAGLANLKTVNELAQ